MLRSLVRVYKSLSIFRRRLLFERLFFFIIMRIFACFFNKSLFDAGKWTLTGIIFYGKNVWFLRYTSMMITGIWNRSVESIWCRDDLEDFVVFFLLFSFLKFLSVLWFYFVSPHAWVVVMRRISLGLSVWPSVLSSVCYKSQNQIERTHSVTHRVLDWMVVHGIQHERGLPDVVVCLFVRMCVVAALLLFS